MRILRVDLENVKSYGQARVPFTPGTNAICGHNGAGKSTLLEAIGFALFDHLAVSQADFVREGENLASVTVHVEDRDGRSYQVVRKCGSYSQYYVYDSELDQKLTDGKQETMVWLKELMGMDSSDELSVLFRDAVGVPQGLLTAAFLETPARRKATFNPLLRVDEYERVWEGLREPGRRLDQSIAEQERQIAGLEARVAVLPGLRERADALTEALSVGEAEQAELAETETEIAADLAVLTERKERLEALDRAVSQAEATVQTTKARLESAQAAVQASEDALAVVEATVAGHEAYVNAQQNLAALEEQRARRDELVDERRQIDQALAVIEERVRQLDAELEAIDEAKATMTSLEEAVATQRQWEHELEAAKRNADRLALAQQNLAAVEARLVDLRQRHADAQTKMTLRDEKEAALEDTRAELATGAEKREALAAEMADLTAKRARIEAQIAETEQHLGALNADLQEDRQQLAHLQDRLVSLRAQMGELQQVEATISDTRERLHDLATHRQQLAQEVAGYEAELAQIQWQIEMLSTSEEPVCPLCGEPLTPEHKADLLAGYRERAEALKVKRDQARAKLDRAAQTLSDKEAELAELEGRARALPRTEEVEALSDQLEAQKEALAKSATAVEAEQQRLAEQEREAERLAQAMEERRPLLEAADEQQAHLQAQARALESDIQALPRLAEVEALDAEIKREATALTETEERIADLAAAPEEVTRLSRALEELGNPRRDYERAGDAVEREPEVQQHHAAALAETESLEARSNEIQEQLSAYKELDAQITARRQALDEHEAAHQRYLQHIREAEALAERQAAVADQVKELAAAESTYTEQNEAREAVAAEYDAGLHHSLTDELAEIRTDLAALSERLRQQRAQLAETEAQIADLETVEAELETAREEVRDLRETQSLLAHLRQVLREAGPQITRALVQIIFLHADRLYADIMQNYRSRLHWTEDYEIVLTTEGRERTFQQLSGGEQMAAALAVRLALLRETSTLDIAFFDEPTANLDSERRANLARQILNVKGFSQLFVISHDDTFEQDTDHVVRVWKENGASSVEA
ncbi:MAG: AAA family ATPase [Anaerolineae bacterium]